MLWTMHRIYAWKHRTRSTKVFLFKKNLLFCWKNKGLRPVLQRKLNSLLVAQCYLRPVHPPQNSRLRSGGEKNNGRSLDSTTCRANLALPLQQRVIVRRMTAFRIASYIPLSTDSLHAPWASAPVILFFLCFVNYFLVFTYIASAASTTKNSYW